MEGFAEIYRNFYADLNGEPADYPGIEDGILGMRFIEQVVASSNAGGVWVEV